MRRKTSRIIGAFMIAGISCVIGYLFHQYVGWVNNQRPLGTLRTFVQIVDWLLIAWVVLTLLLLLRELLTSGKSEQD